MDAQHSVLHHGTGSRAIIDRDALLHNVRLIRGHLAPGVKICAVIKADAYGHGARIVADALLNWAHREMEPPAAEMLAVACIEEAAALGSAVDLPVLIFRPVEDVLKAAMREAVEAAVRAGWILTVCTASGAEAVARLAMKLGRRAKVHLKIDTGMSRWGVPAGEAAELAGRIVAHPALHLCGAYTHFACSERPDAVVNAEQNAAFAGSLHWGPEHAAVGMIRHAANSGAAFFNPAAHWDMVRIGISMYGVDPTGSPSMDRALRPVMKWVAPLTMVRSVPKGVKLGYGQSFTAEREMRIGMVPIGYADGYMRAWSNTAVMMVAGRPARVVGRVSMDVTMIDLSEHTDAVAGDEVAVMDNDPLSPASVYALAKLGGTIPYEVLCRVGNRVAREAV